MKKNKALIQEILEGRLKSDIPKDFNLENICFKQQQDFIMDKNPWIVASCSRRAGKSVGCAVDLIKTAIENKGVVCLYITLTHSMAEKIVWSTLLEFNEKYNFNGKPNTSKLSLTFPNKSKIYVLGCSNKKQVEKVLGVPFKLAYFDECQSFPSFIEDLVDRVVAPALMDYAGTMKFIGTPGAIKSGFFWNILNNPNYSRHFWTYWDNPFIPKQSTMTKEQLLDRELKRRGVSINHPSIRREWFGEWVYDEESLVCKYNSNTNNYITLPHLTDYVIGIDLGFNDADAIAVLGWNKNDKKCYLVEEIVTPKQGITELCEQITLVYNKYKPLKMVMDEGGLGKKIAEELRKRFTLPIQAAEKSRKLEFIELMNDAFRTKHLFAKSTSRFAFDSQLIEWDYDKCTADKMVIKKDPHSDIFDAVLYAYRDSLHWLSEPLKPKLDPKRDWAKITELELLNANEKEQERIEQQEKEEMTLDIMFNMDPEASFEENSIRYHMNNRNKQ